MLDVHKMAAWPKLNLFHHGENSFRLKIENVASILAGRKYTTGFFPLTAQKLGGVKIKLHFVEYFL